MPITPEQLEEINYMISNRNLSILFLITGFAGISFGFLMKKLLGIVVLGLLKFYPIDYGTTGARLEHREIV